MVSILVANVYVNHLKEGLLQDHYSRVAKKMKSNKISKRLEAASIECDFYKIQFK